MVPGERDHPALALVNTLHAAARGAMVDELDRVEDTARADALRPLRQAVRELLMARLDGRPPAPEAVAAVNAASMAAPAAPTLDWGDDAPPRALAVAVGGDAAARERARIAADAIALVAGPGHVDLRACAAPGCVRLLLADHPRRRWCSTRCGDRVRARRYYRRHKAAP